MSNKRIDLTPFEGMTKGEWVYHEGEDGAAWLGTLLIPHIGAETPEHPHGTPYPVLSASGHGYHLTRSDIKAMAAVPDLIAELKRCYEELDEANEVGEALWNVLENWDICMDDYSMHDLYINLDEKYARDNEGRIILKELYSYTEEDGWQPKEQASN